MKKVALTALVVAACSDASPGMHIVVHAPRDVTAVELFVGKTRCGDCPPEGIGPPFSGSATAATPQGGDALVLDGPSDGPTPRTLPTALHDGQATIDLLPQTDDRALDVAQLALVGYDANERVVAVGTMSPDVLPIGASAFYRIDLEEAVERETVSNNDETAETRFYRWRGKDANPATDAPCMAIERADGSRGMPTRTWLLPPNDLDCDALDSANDCDEYRWDPENSIAMPPSTVQTLETASCSKAAGQECRLGAPSAAECQMPDANTACHAFDAPRYCAAPAICAATPCVGNPFKCHQDDLNIRGTTTLTCRARIDPTGLCAGGQTASFGVAAQLFSGSPLACPAATLSLVNQGVSAPGATTIVVPATAPLAASLTVSIVRNVDAPVNDCAFKLTFDALQGATATTTKFSFVVDIVTSGGNLVLPVSVVPGDCTLEALCTIPHVGGEPDALASCLGL